MRKIRFVEQQDKAAWFALDHDFPEAGFDEKVRNRQGYVCVEDGKIIGILRFNLFWDSIPFCNMLHVDAAHPGLGYGRMLMGDIEKEKQRLSSRPVFRLEKYVK